MMKRGLNPTAPLSAGSRTSIVSNVGYGKSKTFIKKKNKKKYLNKNKCSSYMSNVKTLIVGDEVNGCVSPTLALKFEGVHSLPFWCSDFDSIKHRFHLF